MKLPISLLVVAVLSQGLSLPVSKRSEVETTVAESTEATTTVTKNSAPKDSGAKSSGANQNDNNQTSKRELIEGNFGELNKEIVSKFAIKGPPRKSTFAKELEEMISEQTPAHQMFGERLPKIAKISDVLSEHGPSFEAAVARQLESPVPVYKTILSLPTSFEVPIPAASQSGYSNLKADRLRNAGRDEQKLQGVPQKSVKIPEAAEQTNPSHPRYTLNQPRLRFDSHSQALDSGLARQHENLPKEFFQPQEVPRKQMPLLYPLYDQLGPFTRNPEQVLSTQYSPRYEIFHIFPVARDLNKSKEGNRDKDYSNEETVNVKDVTRQLHIDEPVHKQEYHAHPNGAISFTRFIHNLHGSTQHDTAPQPQPETFYQPQPAQYQSQIPPELMLLSQEQNETAVKLPYQLSFQGVIQEIEKYQPLYQEQLQFNPFNQQIQHKPRTLNELQQQLFRQEPRQLSNLQAVQLNRVPAFTPLPQSRFTPGLYLKKASRSPITKPPKPFSYSGQSANYDLSLGQTSAQLNTLPPLKNNYNKYVKPLQTNTTPISMPTLPTSAAKVEPVADQLISSTTIQPDVKGQENPKKQSIQEQTESQSKTPQPLKPEVFHPSQLTSQPASVQSTTYLPFVTNEPQSIFLQYSTPHSTYQSTPRPTPRPTPQRTDVVIQQQEIQEIFFEPSRQASFTPTYRNKPALVLSPEEEVHHLRAQHPHYQLFEQLMPYKQEYQDIHSPQQYIVEARESQQKLVSAKRGKPQQNVIQQHSFPISHFHPLQQFQQQLLQSQQPKLEQYHQQQQGLNLAQQQQESDQAHQQQQQEALEKVQQQQVFELVQQQLLNPVQQQQQQESEQAHQQQQQALEQAHQQQQQALEQAQQQEKQASEQAQQQKQGLEQAQQQIQESEQAQQQIQESEQAQQQKQESEQALQQHYQENSLEPSNQIQISTLTPPRDTGKQTETVEIQQQTESQTELQSDSELQSSTGKPDEPPEHLSDPPLHLQQPYLGPFLTPSVVPQLYARQQLVSQPDHSSLLGVPTYSDVQYFGKFAETLFGNQ